MAKYQIMYWKDIPAQVKAYDETGEYSFPLPDRFQEVIDEIAMRGGNLDTDAYLKEWRWGDMQEIPGKAEEIAKKIANELDEKYPKEKEIFLAQILKSFPPKE